MAKKPSHLKLRRNITLGVLCFGLLIAASFAWSVNGCEGTASASTAQVTIAGQPFTLEVAADNDTRFKGLSERQSIEDDGGMIFVFTQPRIQRFVMRDCFIDIDIIYLDASGSVVRTHAMKTQEPRGPGEGAIGESNTKYEDRLVRYSSGMPSQYVVEIAPGLVEKLGIKPGDKLEFDLKGLKRGAK